MVVPMARNAVYIRKFVRFFNTDANDDFAQQTRIYAAAGTQLLSGVANIPCTFNISGYLVTRWRQD
jgi:hypothetical protein